MNYGERMNELINRSGFQRKDIAERMEITPQNLSQHVQKTHLGTDVIDNFCRAIGIEYETFYVPHERMAQMLSLSPEILKFSRELERIREHGMNGVEIIDDLLESWKITIQMLKKRCPQVGK